MGKPAGKQMSNSFADVLKSIDRGRANMAAFNHVHTACDYCVIPVPALDLLVTEKRSTLEEVAPKIVDQLFRELEHPNPDHV
jgi:hypothetical protein